jgi:CRP/FNR family transcriptional regulator
MQIKPWADSRPVDGFWSNSGIFRATPARTLVNSEVMIHRPAELKTVAMANTLRCCQLFGGLSAEDLEMIAEFTVLRSLVRGEYLFRQGAASEGFYVIQRGAINVHRVNAAGKEQVIHVFRMGESLAEAALASTSGYPADARAVEPSTVLMIPRDPILALIGRRPDLALRMLGSMSQHLRVLVGMLDDLTLKDVETRVANWLLRQSKGRPGPVQLPGTKRVLAAELGTSSETLSRTFASLRDRKIIVVSSKAIAIDDPAALQAIIRRSLGEA